ncbi:MAG: DUF1957 domain-containing protein [Sphaerochaetaceae bacterium]|nr:DUF1957 domain-containing protein [Sphaerochaetaceae bacterium]
MKSYLNFIFNAHLPFVRHPEYEKFLEEDWLYEAINESYIPLLRMMRKLHAEEVPFKLTFSISPTLACMLSDPLLKERFSAYMEKHIELGEKEVNRLQGREEERLARMYLKILNENYSFWRDECGTDLLKAMNQLNNECCIELITTSATHSYLPLYKNFEIATNAQIETSVINQISTFDRYNGGFWLPECGFYPGLEEILKRHNVSWTSLAAHAFALSPEKVLRGNYAPIQCPNGLYCFARDFNLSSLVWSAEEGYPADPDYREFYRDIGYDLPLDYISPYIHEPNVRVFTGFKYWAITGKTADKVLYNPEKAQAKTKLHAGNFLYNVSSRTRSVDGILDTNPCYTISFDAELFGHWWFEGIAWLENVIRLAAESKDIELTTASDFLTETDRIQKLTPGFSSWGSGGFSQVWNDHSTNAWLLRHCFKSVERMQELAVRFPAQTSLKKRFLSQAARETLLLMASDWPFMIHNHTTEEYALKRITGHIENLNLVYDNMSKNAVNTEWLVKAEKRNNIFPHIDYNIFNPEHLKEPSLVYTAEYQKL